MTIDFALWKRIVEVKLKRLEGYHHVSIEQGLYAQVIKIEHKIDVCREMLADPEAQYEAFLDRAPGYGIGEAA